MFVSTVGTSASTARGGDGGLGAVVVTDLTASRNNADHKQHALSAKQAAIQRQKSSTHVISSKGSSVTAGLPPAKASSAALAAAVFGDATARIQNRRNAAADIKQAEKSQQNNGSSRNDSILVRSSEAMSDASRDENAVTISDYFRVGGAQSIVTGPMTTTAPVARMRNNELIANPAATRHVTTLYRTHALQAAGKDAKSKALDATAPAPSILVKPAPLVSALPALPRITAASSLAPVTLVAAEELTAVSGATSAGLHEDSPHAAAGTILHTSDDNVHLDASIAELQKEMETVDLNDNHSAVGDAQLRKMLQPDSAAASASVSPVSTAVVVEPTCEPLLPPPSMAEAALTPCPSSFPRRNSTARGLADHLILAEEQPEIRSHLRQREKAFAVHPNYMSLQPELNYRMREILLDWLQGVSGRFRLKSEAIMLAASLLDRFLSKRECSRDKFQLVGISCLILAAKYEEMIPPTLEEFLAVTDHAFQRKQVLHMEGVILESINYELTIPYLTSFTGPLLLLCPIPEMSGTDVAATSRATRDFDNELKNLTLYYCLASVQHHQFLAYPTSLVAATAVALAYYQLQDDILLRAGRVDVSDQPYWDESMIECSGGYHLSDMTDCMRDFADCVNSMAEHSSPRSASTPASQKYNSITKRFQRMLYDEVATWTVRLPADVRDQLAQRK